MPQLDDEQYFLLLDRRAEVLRAEIVEEQRRWRAYLARWSRKDNVVEFRKSLKATKVADV